MKRMVVLCLSLVLVLGMFQAANAADKMKLTMYAYVDQADPVNVANWEAVLNAFLAANPDIEFEIEYGFSEAYHNKLQTMAVGGQLPDVMFLWPDKRTGYVTGKGLIKDLSPWLKGHEAEFSAGSLTAQGPNGAIYELPEQVTDTHVMFVNEKLLKDLGLTFPKTFDELLVQGEKIKAAGLIPIAMSDKDGWPMQSCLLSTLTERAGGMEWFNKAL
ncbi:MAG: extracellular solute-binding protein, partial [Sedimentisphaerales bacterium]|nr:extracellular solute-binding protein [Sedimentisphaerales bacterium]